MTTASRNQAPDLTQWPPLSTERSAAGQALIEWAATTNSALPRLCLLRGGRSSGKSHLLAWFLTGAASHPATTAHATVPAQGMITDAIAWEMGRQLGYGPLPPHRLRERVAVDPRPLLLLLPDLHLSGRGPADQPDSDSQRIIDELVLPLLQLPHVRAVAETGDATLLAGEDHHDVDLGGLPFPGVELPDDTQPSAAGLRATIPTTPDGRPIWSQAPSHSREHILDAAVDGGDRRAVSSLLADPGFLLHGSVAAVTAALRSTNTTAPDGLRSIWEQAAPQLSSVEHSDSQRAALLHAASLGVSPSLSKYLRPLAEQHHWSATWAQHGRPASAQVQLPQGGGLLVSDLLGRLHQHDPATGTRTGMLPAPAALRPSGIAASSADALLVLDETGALHPVTADEDGPAATVLGHIALHHGQGALTTGTQQPTAIGNCLHSPLVAIGDAGGSVHLWSLTEYRPMPQSSRLHTQPVTAVTCLQLPEDGLDFVVSAAIDGSLRLWDISQAPMETPLDQRPALVTALASAATPIGPVLAVAWDDQEIHLWHLVNGTARVLPLLYHCSSLTLTTTGQLTIGGPDGLHAIQLDLDRL